MRLSSSSRGLAPAGACSEACSACQLLAALALAALLRSLKLSICLRLLWCFFRLIATDPDSEVRDAAPPARQQPCLVRQASARATLSRLRLRVCMRLGLRRLLHAAIAAPVPRRDAPLRARAPEFGVPLLLSRRSPQTLPSW